MKRPLKESIRLWAQGIKRDVLLLWFARRHPDTPLLAKALCVFAVAYALSPIDLIPDFIPVLGYVDEVLLLPAMVWLARRLLPPHVVQDCAQQASAWMAQQKARPRSYIGAAAILLIWVGAGYGLWRLLANSA